MPAPRSLYNHLDPRLRAQVDRLRFALGLLPRINTEHLAHARRAGWPPAPYRACVVVSADLELAWAWRYAKGYADSQALALAQADQTRRNLPALLSLSERFDLPVTWAVVGHLFLERCAPDPESGRLHADIARPPYFENRYWRYVQGDWFDADPGTDWRRDPAWYAPDLLRAILASRVRHEIGGHSFSHIDCTRATPEAVDGDLTASAAAAAEWGLTLKSFVFPGNFTGNYLSLRRHGFSAYRWPDRFQLDVPWLDELGLWRIPGGLHWELPLGWPTRAWIKAVTRSVDLALETGALLHLWFHPSCRAVDIEQVFPAVLDYIAARRGDLWITTMGALAEALSSSMSFRNGLSDQSRRGER